MLSHKNLWCCAVIGGEWAEQLLTFAEYKARGPVILKSAETAELVEKLEDSQMTLGSLASNRYSAPFRDEVSNRHLFACTRRISFLVYLLSFSLLRQSFSITGLAGA